MSSSQTSSSSSSGADGDHPFAEFSDIRCPVSVVLGEGAITVRRCLGLQRYSVVPLKQLAGEDLHVMVNGVTVARGEVVIVEDSTAIRITDIPTPPGTER
jgi:flagellar motor switch protein FliN/FliY